MTRVVGLIGDPVAHSLSPAMHNAAYAALGLDYRYLAFRVSAEAVAPALSGARALGFAGLNVTVPHKLAALAACDEVSDEARAIGAVNTVVFRAGAIVGHNTDAAGLIDVLQSHGIEGEIALVLGAGGAARAVIAALAGWRTVRVHNRSLDRARELASLGPIEVVTDRGRGARDARLVVNATSLGLQGEAIELPWALLDEQAVIIDLVYAAEPTPLVLQARARGHRAFDGRHLLVAQGERAFALFTGAEAPAGVMAAAAGLDVGP